MAARAVCLVHIHTCRNLKEVQNLVRFFAAPRHSVKRTKFIVR